MPLVYKTLLKATPLIDQKQTSPHTGSMLSKQVISFLLELVGQIKVDQTVSSPDFEATTSTLAQAYKELKALAPSQPADTSQE